jgi:hypothetical protein
MAAETPSLEVQLINALLVQDLTQAEQLASQLHARGFDLATLEQALAAQPQLEAQLWDVMRAVIPLSRREKKRRAIRAAEERDWADWNEGKRET